MFNNTKFMLRAACILGASLLNSLIVSPAFSASTYTVVDLGKLDDTSPFSMGIGVNNGGQTTGRERSPAGVSTGFIYDGGAMTNLGTLGGTRSGGWGVNESGQVAGWSTTAGDAATHAYLYDSGTMKDLGTLGGTNSTGTRVNNNGQVAGYSGVSGNAAQHAFLYENGIMTDIGTLGGTNSFGFDINASGQMTGASDISGDGEEHAFLYSDGVMSDLGTLGGEGGSRGWGMNDSGQVTGRSFTAGDNEAHAFIYKDGTMIDIASPEFLYSNGQDISNDGTVVGIGDIVNADYDISTTIAFLWTEEDGMLDLNSLIDPSSELFGEFILSRAFGISDDGKFIAVDGTINGERHAFRLELVTPSAVPLPAGVWLFASALGGFGFMFRKKKKLA